MCELCNNSHYDPTRTTALRNLFAKDMKKRFAWLSKQIYEKIVVEDCFGLTDKLTVNADPFIFSRSAEKVEAFMVWLREQVRVGILQMEEAEQIGAAIESAWTNLYITDSYKRGIIRARYELQKAGFDVPDIAATGGVGMSMMLPLHMDRLGLLYSRVYTDLKGITDAMDAIISRILTQGMADGDNPLLLAKKILGAINGTGVGDLGLTDTLGRYIPPAVRAEMLARTEIIRAHHQAMIQEYMNWGVLNIIVKAEFRTAGDERVCDKCAELEAGGPYELSVAMNLIPVHPRCRCICLPFMEGVHTKIPKYNYNVRRNVSKHSSKGIKVSCRREVAPREGTFDSSCHNDSARRIERQSRTVVAFG